MPVVGIMAAGISPQFIDATGGTEYTSGGYKYHKFTSSGTFSVSGAPATATVEVLAVAGGGGGAQSGGGGAGGLKYVSSQSISAQNIVHFI